MPVLTGLIRSMVLAWEPDSALATSSMLSEAVVPDGNADTFGWLLCLSRSHRSLPPLPEPVRVEPLEDKGTLIVLAPEKMTIGNPEHVELSRRLHDLLSKAGLLGTVAG